MKIDSLSSLPPPPSESQVRPKSTESEAYAISDSVGDGSAAASQVGQSVADQRALRIAAIKASLADGSYKADPAKIADGIIDSANLDEALSNASKA